jgi:O-antigen/teichoic acid export membrane protein
MATPATQAAAHVSETSSVFKPAMLLMSGQTVAFAATFFIPVVLARVLSPMEFGTYKQLFLLYSTAFLIGQVGMATSLYYFVPRSPEDAGRYAANATMFLGAAGLAGFGLLWAGAPRLAHWMSNAELAQYIPWIGLYLLLMLVSAPLEIVLVARGRYLWASAAYALSDIARAIALIVPVLLFHRLDWLLRGAALVAGLRVVAAVIYFHRDCGPTFRPDRRLVKGQMTYALPFALAVLVETVQASLPQYVVSYLYDPISLAILAVGCLQIPLVSLAASPISDVMMVKMQESLARGRPRAVLAIWHDTTCKLALLMLPMVACLAVVSREVIVFLFTEKYSASVPLFTAWLMTILLITLQVDGVMRVFARTRFLLVLNLVRLAIIAGLIKWSLDEFHLLGAILTAILATFVFKAAALWQMRSWLGVGLAELLPWRRLAGLVAAASGAALATLLVKSRMHGSPLTVLLTAGLVYVPVYAALVWVCGLLTDGEREAIAGYARKALFMTRVPDFRTRTDTEVV